MGNLLTIRLEPDLERILDRLCRETGRTRSDVVREALRRQLTLLRFENLRRRVLPLCRGAWLPDRRGHRQGRVVRVLLDTNVLASAFATRGLCADVLRHVLAGHDLLVGEVVLEELRQTLTTNLGLPPPLAASIEELLRDHEVIPKPERPATLTLRDPDDRWIAASAVAGHADVLVTGDRDLLDVAHELPVRVLDPRGFWDLLRGSDPPTD